MIQATLKTDFEAFINTAANQIDISGNTPPTIEPHNMIYYMAKFTNDMSGDIVYCYPKPQIVTPRYSKFNFKYVLAPDMFQGELNLKLAGYWHYEFYEVDYAEKPSDNLNGENSPACELVSCVLDAAPDHGIVTGLVAIGKMYVAEKTEEVQYDEYIAPTNTNYIYQGT